MSYGEGLARIPAAYASGFEVDAPGLEQLVSSPEGLSAATIIGSGGSFSAARMLAVFLHEHFGIPAIPVTPYEVSRVGVRTRTAVFVSASGRNSDVLEALDVCLATGCARILVITADGSSELACRAAEARPCHVLTLPAFAPGEREGFLSLQFPIAVLGYCLKSVGLAHGASTDAASWCDLQQTLAREVVRDNDELRRVISDRTHLVAVGVGWAWPAIVDLESKVVEGGLGSIEICEAKNYTHGRFVNTLARARDTALLLFCLKGDERLRAFFRSGIGTAVPVVPVSATCAGGLGLLSLLLQTFYLVEALAEVRGVNVSRPGVPDWARRMFAGKGLYLPEPSRVTVEKVAASVVQAKASQPSESAEGEAGAGVSYDREMVRAWVRRVGKVGFVGLALDFDGTMAPLGLDSIDEDVVKELNRLAQAGLRIAVVTGRGRSAVVALRQTLPRSVWGAVECHLYNGGAEWRLDSMEPQVRVRLEDGERIRRRLAASCLLKRHAKSIELASLCTQVSIHLRDPAVAPTLVAHVRKELRGWDGQLEVLSSGKSIDVFPKGVGKREVIRKLRTAWCYGGAMPDLLVVGDMGHGDGNDSQMLKEQWSFSVDRVSSASNRCFPVVSRNGRVLTGVRGTAFLLQHLVCRDGAAYLRLWLRRVPRGSR